MREPALSIEGLRVSFEGTGGRHVAVDGVSLAIEAGRTVAVVGESGSGKSATALSVLGLLASPPARVEGGAVWFRARQGVEIDLLRADARTLRRVRGGGVAMIFQEPMTALNPVRTVGSQIVEAIRLHRECSRKAAVAAARGALEEVRLPEPGRVMGAYPHELSGGMRQRAMIAMALACDPAVMLADEPTTALDATVQRGVLELLRERQHARGMGMLLITHALNVARAVADVIAVMYAGRIVEEGPAEALMERPRHPYTRALLACAPSIHHRPERLATVADAAEGLGEGGDARAWWPRADGTRPAARMVEVGEGHRVLHAEREGALTA